MLASTSDTLMFRNEASSKRCPQCRQNTLLFKSRVPVLSAAMDLRRTGTNPHDGSERLRYESAWVCENVRCIKERLSENIEAEP
jgi:hypothetical protein